MFRRGFLAAASVFAAPVWAAEPIQPGTWRQFEVTTRVTLRDPSGPERLWLPLAQTAGGYQTVLDARFQASGRVELVRDTTYGAPLLRATWDAAATPRQVEVVQRIATSDRGSLPMIPLTQAERAFWTAPQPSVPTDGIVRETADRITAGYSTPRERLRAIYDWVVDTTWRDPDTPGCGYGDVKSMLESRKFGGKCADINSLMVGLARAAGFQGEYMLSTGWVKVLDCGASSALELATAAKRMGLLDLRMAGDVFELNVDRLDPQSLEAQGRA